MHIVGFSFPCNNRPEFVMLRNGSQTVGQIDEILLEP
ncbi:hypothetical protein SDC9_180427 [bioreactor metagenome]|uniref:Uncharacterized protein n=1 Tax=bioreactor metagenome TaxID=1076179 RepID=A0A645H9T2_9ZZZZ